MGEWPWKLVGLFALGTCICVPSFMALWLTIFEKTHLVPHSQWVVFLQIVISFSKKLSFFSTSRFAIDFLCLLMNSTNRTAVPVSLPVIWECHQLSLSFGGLQLHSHVCHLFAVLFCYCNDFLAHNPIRWPYGCFPQFHITLSNCSK